jgi:Zn-dependent protease
MGLINQLTRDPLTFVLGAIPLLYSIIIHELAHGWVAYKMGDPTAKWAGRLSLNPLKHLDPIGTLMLFLVGFGWAKPVPVNLNNIPNRRKALIFVSSAGVLANMLIAFTVLLFFRLSSLPTSRITADIANNMVNINITLAALNLIPIPPLDGSKILMGFASEKVGYFLARMERYGLFIIIALFYLGILDFLIDFFRWIIISVLKLLLG